MNRKVATPSINIGQKISFKITNPTISSTEGISKFVVDKAFNVEGNIMSLLYGDNFEGQIDLSGKDKVFYKLFNNCTTLKSTENLILPATTLASHCYSYMFEGCTGLTTVPKILPATTLATYCYSWMFYGCTSLISTPQLPATTLVDYCYSRMFSNCTSLTTAPQLPATTLVSNCYPNMFYGCTNLTTAPELPATTLVDYCYYSMFRDCSNLNYIKMLATNISATVCLDNWVSGVASTGTFVKHPNMTTLPNGYSGIPSGWTVVNDGEESDGLVFPVTLESGDNGDIGKSLYSYLQNTYGESASITPLNEEIINNYDGAAFNTISYATWMGFTGYWLNGHNQYMTSWVLLEDGYLQRVELSQD